MDDLLMKMVMEAENSRKRNARKNQDDEPTDYGANLPSPDDEAPPEDQPQGNQDDEPIDYTADAPEPDEGEAPPEDQGGGDEDTGTDYTADAPDPDEGDAPADDPNATNQPPADAPEGDPNAAGGAVTVDAGDPGTADQNAPDTGTDYGADVPDPDAPAEGDPNTAPADPNNPQGADPNADPNAPAPEEGGDQPPAEGGEGDPNAPADDPNATGTEGEADASPEDPATGELNDTDKANMVLFLLRNFIRLHKDIRTYITKIQDAHRETMLASAASNQVIQNLTKIRDMTYYYILYEFDHVSYEEAEFALNYLIELVSENLEMLATVKKAEEKARKLKEDKKSKKS